MPHGPVILLVDDEIEILNLVASELRDAGFSVLEAASGKAALSLLNDTKVDIVVTDYFMAGMDGVKMLQAIHEQTGSAPPAILISGLIPAMAKSANVNVVGIVEKPFLPDEIVQAVRQVAVPESRSALRSL